jgi:uracil-DNA glycosylase
MKNIVNHIDNSWNDFFRNQIQQEYFLDLLEFINSERLEFVVYPEKEEVFTAFRLTPVQSIKIVLLGQDPYHGPGQAHGLSFSVREDVKIPPSLRNIFQELRHSTDFEVPVNGNLTAWASQGIFLLNSVLTVRNGQAGSHGGKGWEKFTDNVINYISDHCNHVVFLLWGNYAQSKRHLIAAEKHLILTAAHPSPLSAYRGFFGCNHFLLANDFLLKNGTEMIKWQL